MGGRDPITKRQVADQAAQSRRCVEHAQYAMSSLVSRLGYSGSSLEQNVHDEHLEFCVMVLRIVLPYCVSENTWNQSGTNAHDIKPQSPCPGVSRETNEDTNGRSARLCNTVIALCDDQGQRRPSDILRMQAPRQAAPQNTAASNTASQNVSEA